MGQYYKPIILAENKKTVKQYLSPYSYSNGAKLMEHSWIKNDLVRAFENLIEGNPQRVVWAGDYADTDKNRKTNLYERAKDKLEVKPIVPKFIGKFVVNHTTKEFVNKTKVPKDTDGWQIHPLPILTCEGNGRGGGDLNEESELIGLWARDVISIEKKAPKGFTEVIFDIIEG